MKVSIITPCYNSEKSIEKTILSVLGQDYFDIEYIIVDGASNDSTMDIVNKYRNQIHHVISEPDRGIADAYNKGIKLATGELIGIVASDDQLLIGAISKLVKAYDGHSDVVCGGTISWNEVGFRYTFSEPELEKLRYYCSIDHPATYIRKDAYEKYGDYSVQFKSAMDRELLLRFYCTGATFQILKFPISLFCTIGGISYTNVMKCSFKEDKAISIQYGLHENEATRFYIKKVANYKFKSFFKFLLKKMGLWDKVVRKIDRRYMDCNIVKEQIFNFEENFQWYL